MSDASVDIGILTIRDDEFRAVLKCFPDEQETFRGRHRQYAIRTADAGDGGRYRVAILRQIEQGNGEAQEAARDFIDDLHPSLLLVVGIAGGLPSDDISLGDVVLSTRIHDFSLEARKFADEPTYNLGGGPIAKVVAAGVANLSAREEDLGDWWEELPTKPKVQPNARNQTYGSQKWQRLVKEKLVMHYGRNAVPRHPIVADGPIASSDRLVKDPKLLVPLLSAARGVLAVEMESAGVHRATRDNTPMLSIRALSDIVGFKRQDAWTKYACAAAAAFARAYLRTTPIPLRRPAAGGDGKAITHARPPEKPSEDHEEEAFADLIGLRHFPERLFIGPALCNGVKHGWTMLRKSSTNGVLPAWMLHESNVYSFADLERFPLSKIVDTGGIDNFKTTDWAFSDDPNKRRLFVYLLNAALREDLWCQGVRYYSDQDAYAFMGRLDDPPRTLNYANLKVRSTTTVVAHYENKSKKTGKTHKYLRHAAFQGRFRFLGGSWYLEITPTYRFTHDGRKLDHFHEKRLSGIKRLERNRSVVSQLLVWQALLRAPWPRADQPRVLEFGPLTSFRFTSEVDEGQLTALDAPSVPLADEAIVP